MIRRLISVAIAAGALVPLAGCGGQAAPNSAAASASRLLTAAYEGDRIAFEAEIDRAAVRADVRRQVTKLAQVAALEIDGGPSEFALDRMISPQAIRLVHAGAGEALTAAPTAKQVASLMKPVDARHACLRAAPGSDRCVLTFGKADRDWRLVGMSATGLRIELAAR